MPLVRKTRESGGSLVIAIPSQLVEAFELSKGDNMQIVPLKNGEIRIKKLNTEKASASS